MTTRKTRSRLSRKVGPDHVAIGILNQFRIKKKGDNNTPSKNFANNSRAV